MPFGPLEIGIVLLIVLIIFGPKRLPDLGRSLGGGMREFKDSVTGNTRDSDDELPTRIIIARAAIGVSSALCYWQNDKVLEIVNRPLPKSIPEPITFGVTE